MVKKLKAENFPSKPQTEVIKPRRDREKMFEFPLIADISVVYPSIPIIAARREDKLELTPQSEPNLVEIIEDQINHQTKVNKSTNNVESMDLTCQSSSTMIVSDDLHNVRNTDFTLTAPQLSLDLDLPMVKIQKTGDLFDDIKKLRMGFTMIR